MTCVEAVELPIEDPEMWTGRRPGRQTIPEPPTSCDPTAPLPSGRAASVVRCSALGQPKGDERGDQEADPYREENAAGDDKVRLVGREHQKGHSQARQNSSSCHGSLDAFGRGCVAPAEVLDHFLAALGLEKLGQLGSRAKLVQQVLVQLGFRLNLRLSGASSKPYDKYDHHDTGERDE